MKRHLLAMCGAVALAGLTVSAQELPPPATPPTPPTQQTPPTQPPQTPPPTQQTPPAPAQRPPDPYPATPSSRVPSVDMSGAITLTGCLKTFDSRTMAPATGAGSGAGSAASAPSGGSAQFVLTNVERAQAAGGPKGTSFLVKSTDPAVVFSEHLNHKVSLTGTVSDAASGMGRGTDRSADQPTPDKPSPNPSAEGRGPDDMKMPTLNVTALKMVSPTCGS